MLHDFKLLGRIEPVKNRAANVLRECLIVIIIHKEFVVILMIFVNIFKILHFKKYKVIGGDFKLC